MYSQKTKKKNRLINEKKVMEHGSVFLKRLDEDTKIIINTFPFVVGRCKTANLVIAHVNVSRSHCKIMQENRFWKILDCSSSGTYINNDLIGKGNSKILNNGDVVRFGPVESGLSWSFFTLSSTCAEINKNYNLSNASDANKKVEAVSTVEENANFNLLLTKKDANEKDISSTSCKSSPEKKTNHLNLEYLMCKESQHLNNEYLKNKKYIDNDLPNKETEYKDLENQLLKKEEEKKILLKKVIELEETQKILFQKLNNDPNSDGTMKKFKVENHTEFSSEKIEMSSSEKNFSNTPGLLTDLASVKNTTFDLENKNSISEANCSNFELVHSKSTLLENFTDLMETEFQCTICSELFVTAVTLNCTHTFCKYCINQWKKKQKTCPICRKKITNETRSLVVDNYIDKVVENLSFDIKSHREKVILERKESIPSKKPKALKHK